MSFPKSFQRRELLQLLLAKVTVSGIEGRGLHVSVNEQIRGALVLCGLQCLLEFPLGASHRNTPIDAAIFANRSPLRQQCSQPRP